MELIFDFFEAPGQAAASLRQKKPLALGVLCLLMGALSFFIAADLPGSATLLPFGWISLSLFLLWELAAGFAMVALIHLIAEMQGAQGSAVALFIFFGLADLVWALAVPAALLLTAVFPKTSAPLAATLLLLGLCNLSLKARSLKDNYQMHALRAWITLLLPYLAALLASVLAFSLAVAGLVLELMKSLS